MNWKLCILGSLVVGCSSGPEEVPEERVRYVYVEPDCGEPLSTPRVEMKPVTWKILPVSGENHFVLTPDAYANLGDNFTSILAAARETMAVIRYYEGCLDNITPPPQ